MYVSGSYGFGLPNDVRKPECGDIASRLYGHEMETANKDGALHAQYACSWTEVDTCIRQVY